MTSGWEMGPSLSQCGHVFVSFLRGTSELIGHLDIGSCNRVTGCLLTGKIDNEREKL